MKKIIAMLLCVALVAAMGVSAFAGTPDKPDSKTETFSIKQWGEYLGSKATAAETAHAALVAGTVKDYADAVAAAKAVYANNLSAYNAGIKTAVSAIQFAQYATVADYVAYATELYAANATNAINQAIAEFYVELADALGVEFADVYSE